MSALRQDSPSPRGQRPLTAADTAVSSSDQPLVVEPTTQQCPGAVADAGTGVGAERNVRADQRDAVRAPMVLMLKAWRRRKRCTARKSTGSPRTGCHL